MQSQVDNKRIAKNTVALYIRMIIVMLVGLYTSRVVLNALGAVDFGLYTVVGGVVSIFSFIQGSMTASTQRYLTFELGQNNINKLKLVFMTSTYIHLLVAFIILILSETIGLYLFFNKLVIPLERINTAFWVLQISVISTMIRIMYYPLEAVIIAHEKMGAFAYLSILDVCFKLIIAILITISSYDKLLLYAILNLVIVLVMRSITTIYCKHNFAESKYCKKWDKQLFKEMGSFAAWNMWGNIAYVLNNYGFQVLLNTFFGPAINAASTIGSAVSGHISKFSDGFQTAINPQITKTYSNNHMTDMHTLIYRSMKFSCLLLLIIAAPIIIELPLILKLWLKTPPNHTTQFALISLVIGFLNAIKNPINQAISATGNVKYYQTTTGLILILVVPIAYIVLTNGGAPEDAMLTYAIIFLIMDIVGLFFLHKQVSVSLKNCFKQSFLPVMFVIVIGAIIPLTIKKIMPHSILNACFLSLITFISFSISALYFGLSKNERIFVLSKIGRKKNSYI